MAKRTHIKIETYEKLKEENRSLEEMVKDLNRYNKELKAKLKENNIPL